MVDESDEQEQEEDDALTFAHRRRCRWTTEIRLAGEAKHRRGNKVSLLSSSFFQNKKKNRKEKKRKKELPDLEQHKTKEEVKWHTGWGEVAGGEEEGNAVEIGGEEVGGGSELPDLGGSSSSSRGGGGNGCWQQ